MLTRSPSGRSGSPRAALSFSSASDSPVNADSSVCNSTASVRRRSAGTTLPASSSTRSPGTSSVAAQVIVAPSRTTCASGAAIIRSAATARSARYSCTAPTSALRITITMIAMVSSISPMKPEITAAASSTRIMKSANWPARIPGSVRGAASMMALGPVVASRSAAAALLRPSRRSLCSAATAAAGVCRCQLGSTVAMRSLTRGMIDAGTRATSTAPSPADREHFILPERDAPVTMRSSSRAPPVEFFAGRELVRRL